MEDFHYISYLSTLHSSHLSSQTKRVYANRFKHFMQFLADYPETAKHSPILQCALFLQHLVETEGLKANSINAYRSSLIHCLQHAGLAEMQLPPRLPSEVPTINKLSTEEFQRYIATASRLTNERDKAIAFLVALEGFGPSRCSNLKIGDLRINGERISVATNAAHLQNLNALTITALSRYRPELFHHHLTENSPVLLNNRSGKPVSAQTVDYIVRTIGLRCGLVVCARTLRHSSRSNVYATD